MMVLDAMLGEHMFYCHKTVVSMDPFCFLLILPIGQRAKTHNMTRGSHKELQ